MDTHFQRIAVIDLGTNTFNLLVAEIKDGSIDFIHRESEGVAFGLGSMQSKKITPDAVQRAVLGLEKFKKRTDSLGCREMLAFSTAVLRNAENKVEVLHQIERATGINIQIISGEQEAHWIARAAIHGIEDLENCLVLDIGGGSVEMIEIRQRQIHQLASFPLGVTRLLELKPWSDPLSEQDVIELHAYFETTSGAFLSNSNFGTLVATAGVFETLVKLLYKQESTFIRPVQLNLDKLTELIETWAKSTTENRETWSEIIPVRRKTLQITAILILWIINKIACKSLVATPNSLAEGVVLERYAKQYFS